VPIGPQLAGKTRLSLDPPPRAVDMIFGLRQVLLKRCLVMVDV
jgi:hypothetical protein